MTNGLLKLRSRLIVLSLLVLVSGTLGRQNSTTAWVKASLVLPTINGSPSGISFTKIFFAASGEGWATFVMGEHPNLVHGVAKSSDHGGSWELLPLRGYNWIDSLYFLDTKRGWISTNDPSGTSSAVLLHTTDGGKTWVRWSSLESLKVRALLDMHYDESGEALAAGFVMPGQLGVVLRSSDFGETWHVERSTAQTLKRLVIRGQNTFVWGDSGEILRKSDKDWQVARRGDDILMGLDAPTADSVFAIRHRGRVFRSTDSGRTWEAITLPVPYDDLFLGAIKFADPRLGWVAGHRGVILATNDAGKSWKLDGQVPSYFLRDIGLTENRVFVVGDDGAIFWRNKTSSN